MLGAVGVVLLIACVNIAGLMLARGTARFREMGIRAALGATRGRMVAQLLLESALLAAFGGVAGVALGLVGTNALVALMPEGRLPSWVTFGVDWRFAGFTVAVTAASAILFGLWPALESSRVDVLAALQESAKGSSSAGRKRSLNWMVAGEVALAVVLLVGAGLLVQAFRRLQAVNPGFRAQSVLTYRVSLPRSGYEKAEQRIAFFQALQEKNKSIPGVVSAGAASAPPLMGHWGMFYEVEKSTAPPAGKEAQDPVVLTRVVMPGYFETMGIRLMAGRWFNETDGTEKGVRAVIVNETFAKRFWPGVNAVGQRMKNRGSKSEWATVVGVAGDVKHYGLEEQVRPGVYAPIALVPRDSMVMVLRAGMEPTALIGAARQALREVNPEVPMYEVRTMEDRMGESMWMRRTYSWLLWVFAGIALVLASGGIYGVISYSVGRRTREIGIRMALGAQQRQVLGEVLRQGLVLGGCGLVVGLGCAYFTARYMGTMLFGVDPRDPWVYGFVAAALLAVAAAANLAPARRAAGVNPMTALRME
jgi:predicted permease